MATYTYKARDAAGKSVKGTMDIGTTARLIDKLHNLGYMPTHVKKAAVDIQMPAIFDELKWISNDDKLMFYIQLSNMINAGIPILSSLSTLSKQIENKNLKETVADIAMQIEAGSSLSQAFASYPHVFNKLFVSMVKVGEESGKLNTVLIRYADFFERSQDLKEKIKGALFYPIILLCAGIAVTLFIVTFVIPQFAHIYLKAGIVLPLPTLIVYKIGTAIKLYWYLLIASVIAVLLGLKYYFSTESGSLLLSKLKLRMYLFGPLYRKVCMSRFARTFATLLESNVPILKTLDITQEVIGNEVLGQVIANVKENVQKGEQMTEPLKICKEFPPDVVQMISIGEESGELAEMLNKIADFYDMTIGYSVKKITTIIEPLFLVILGTMVGVMMASMLLPIFDMMKILRH